MGIKRYIDSLKPVSSIWTEGICKELKELGYSFDKNSIKKHYKKIKVKTKYVPGVSIKKELETLKEKELIKPNLKKALLNNKKKCSSLSFELSKNRHLLLLNESMLDLSYKECEELEEKRKNTDYHFDFLLEDLRLQLFYEERKLQELSERLMLLYVRIDLLNNIINIKNTNNSIIDMFIEEFHKATNAKDEIYQYEIEASNILNEKKYSEEEIDSDKEDLEMASNEAEEVKNNKEKQIIKIGNLNDQIGRVESIIDITDDNSKKLDRKLINDNKNNE